MASTSAVLWLVLTATLAAALITCRIRHGILERRLAARRVQVANRVETGFAGIALVATSLLTALGVARFEWSVPLAWVVAVNVATFAAYGLDKFAAVLHVFRIPESTLHVLAFGGGTVGAYVAMDMFRHKISDRKRTFRRILRAIVALQLTVIVMWARHAAPGTA